MAQLLHGYAAFASDAPKTRTSDTHKLAFYEPDHHAHLDAQFGRAPEMTTEICVPRAVVEANVMPTCEVSPASAALTLAQPQVTTGQPEAARRHSSLMTMQTYGPCLKKLGKE